jgi:polyhydroxyalkanoate synthesis regulator protein
MQNDKARQFIKYQNRKIYDKDNGCYTTMETLIGVVRSGVEITVADDRTSDDVTVATLARVLYDMARSDERAFAATELSKLICKAPSAVVKKRKKKTKKVEDEVAA